MSIFEYLNRRQSLPFGLPPCDLIPKARRCFFSCAQIIFPRKFFSNIVFSPPRLAKDRAIAYQRLLIVVFKVSSKVWYALLCGRCQHESSKRGSELTPCLYLLLAHSRLTSSLTRSCDLTYLISLNHCVSESRTHSLDLTKSLPL